MTEDEAIGTLLDACGSPGEVAADGGMDTRIAKRYLDTSGKRIAGLGWLENRETGVQLTRNASNELSLTEVSVGLPAGTKVLSVTTAPEMDRWTQVRWRPPNLWWKDHSISTGTPWTKVFQTDIDVTRVVLLPFTMLGEQMALYIVMDAARKAFDLEFIKRLGMGVTARHQANVIRQSILVAWEEAKIAFERTQTEEHEVNLLATHEAMDIRGRRRNRMLRT